MAHLRTLNDTYRNEIGTPASSAAEREQFFENLSQVLKRRLRKMDDLKPRSRHSADGKSVVAQGPARAVHDQAFARGHVKSLVAFHETQIGNVGAIDRQGELIVRVRQWLFRQGATVSPSGDIIWSKSKAELKYDTELAQQALTRISIRGGLLLDASGKPLDTRQMVTAAQGPGWCIYVMSAENNIHISSHSVGSRHHSSLLAGGMVACAGEMQVHDGRLIVLSNKSGHYTPPPVYLTQVVRVLAEGGVEEASYRVLELLPPDGSRKVEHPKASLFMDSQRIPAWPADDHDDSLVANPHYAAAYAGLTYSNGDLMYSDPYAGRNAGGGASYRDGLN